MIASMIDRGLMLTMQAIRRQLAAMPHDLFLIRLIHHQTRRPFPGERLWTATQLLHPCTVRFLRIRNREGCDIYIQPFADTQNAGYILVDLDRADSNIIDRMRANGHDPCLVLQTSPGRLQAWVQVAPSPLPPSIATSVARMLAHHYNGDPASADWRHLGRLAGFTNQKPERRTNCGYAPWVRVVHAIAGCAPKAEAMLQSAQQFLPSRPSVDASSIPGLIPTGEQNTTLSMTAAEAIKIYDGCLRRWRIVERFPRTDWSIVDLWVARWLLQQGHPLAAVEAVLRLASPQFPRRHSNADDYLRRTMARAAFSFSPQGHSVCQLHAPDSDSDTRKASSNLAGDR